MSFHVVLTAVVDLPSNSGLLSSNRSIVSKYYNTAGLKLGMLEESTGLPTYLRLGLDVVHPAT